MPAARKSPAAKGSAKPPGKPPAKPQVKKQTARGAAQGTKKPTGKTAPKSSGKGVTGKAQPSGAPKAKSGKGPPVPAPLAPRFFRYQLPRQDDGVRHWLLKTEPESFSWDDLERAPERTTCWDGVRNFQARNFLRDHMRVGDLAFIYHSNAEPTAVVGIARVVRESYPDPTAFEPDHHHYDPKSDPANPTWVMVDMQAVEALRPVSLAEMRETPGLEGMELVQVGSRLSITPVTAEEWAIIVRLGRER